MEINYKFFADIQNTWRFNAYLVIQYHWKKKLKRLKIKRETAAAAKAAAAKKKSKTRSRAGTVITKKESEKKVDTKPIRNHAAPTPSVKKDEG